MKRLKSRHPILALAIREYVNENLIRYHYAPTRTANIKKPKCLLGCKATGPLIHCMQKS